MKSDASMTLLYWFFMAVVLHDDITAVLHYDFVIKSRNGVISMDNTIKLHERGYMT